MSSRSHTAAKSRHPRMPGSRIAWIAGLALLALIFVSKHWLSLDSLREHRDALQRMVSDHYWPALALVSLVTIAQTALSLPFSPFLVILSGMVFGLWVGTVSMVITTSLGSVLALLVVRHLAHDFAQRRLGRHPKAQRMLKSFKRHPNSYLLFLRFEPGMPLWLANIVCGLTDIGLWRFSLLTLVGVIPDTFIFANVGANLAKLKSGHGLLSPGILVALSLVAILALVPVAIEKLRRRGRR